MKNGWVWLASRGFIVEESHLTDETKIELLGFGNLQTALVYL
jgi:hypothetical protein